MKKQLKDFIKESPEFVGSTEFGLEKTIINRELASKLLKKKKELIQDSDDYEIFRTGSDRNGNIVLYNKESELIEYFVAYEALSFSGLGSYVTQVKLWRHTDSRIAIGKTSEIFFGYLLNKYKSIMSDSQQTRDGAKFWRSRLAEATGKGYRIGLANLNSKEMIWYDKKTDGLYQYWIKSLENKAWGIGNKYQAMRFVISN